MPVERRLDDIVGGETLAADVVAPDGELLFAEGARITPEHLQVLRKRGVPAVLVAVEAGEAGPGGDDGAVRLAECLARHDLVFSKVRDDARMEVIRQASRDYLAAGNLPPT